MNSFRNALAIFPCLLSFAVDIAVIEAQPLQRQQHWREVVDMPHKDDELLIKFRKEYQLPLDYERAHSMVETALGTFLADQGLGDVQVSVIKEYPELFRASANRYLLIQVTTSMRRLKVHDLKAAISKNTNVESTSPNYILDIVPERIHGGRGKFRLRIGQPPDHSRMDVPPVVVLTISSDPAHVSAALDSRPIRNLRATRPPNPTAPNAETQYLSGDFTDSDRDGMTNVAERKYGFDPSDPSSFPSESAYVAPVEIDASGMGAIYETGVRYIALRWRNLANSTFSLTLRAGTQIIYRGGHYREFAPVPYDEFNLSGREVLRGHFSEYDLANQWIRDYPEFELDLSLISMLLGDPSHRISFTFDGFPFDREQLYREFLKRAIPIMRAQLGPPAEQFNCVITNMGPNSDYFMVVDRGRTFLSDTTFLPRLIVHELVHAWKGGFTFTSDENWNYDPSLSGFEEGSAEGMAFEVIHEYVRSYPTDVATLQLLRWRPYQYWSARTTYYDFIRRDRTFGGGDFWPDVSTVTSRYSVAASTFQVMRKTNPNCYKDIMQAYFARVDSDPMWRPNRADLVELFAQAVPQINRIETSNYLETLPVFQGHELQEGMYVLSTIRPYGQIGDQQFATSYAIRDGKLWWGIRKSEVADFDLPYWIRYYAASDPYVYVDTQNEHFNVNVMDVNGQLVADIDARTNIDRNPDGSPTGFGWRAVDELDMERFPLGLYREAVTFTTFAPHDPGGRQEFHFIGYDGFLQNSADEFVIMVAIEGVPTGESSISVDGSEYTSPITNGVAVFRSEEWPFDFEGEFAIRVTNERGTTHSYYRTLLEAGTVFGFIQHQFLIFDRDFNGIEDEFDLF